MLYISESDWANSFLGCKVERKVWLNVDFTILFIFLFCASWLLWSKESWGKTITRKDYYDLNLNMLEGFLLPQSFVLHYLWSLFKVFRFSVRREVSVTSLLGLGLADGGWWLKRPVMIRDMSVSLTNTVPQLLSDTHTANTSPTLTMVIRIWELNINKQC